MQQSRGRGCRLDCGGEHHSLPVCVSVCLCVPVCVSVCACVCQWQSTSVPSSVHSTASWDEPILSPRLAPSVPFDESVRGGSPTTSLTRTGRNHFPGGVVSKIDCGRHEIGRILSKRELKWLKAWDLNLLTQKRSHRERGLFLWPPPARVWYHVCVLHSLIRFVTTKRKAWSVDWMLIKCCWV